jgi:hypothetical protein
MTEPGNFTIADPSALDGGVVSAFFLTEPNEEKSMYPASVWATISQIFRFILLPLWLAVLFMQSASAGRYVVQEEDMKLMPEHILYPGKCLDIAPAGEVIVFTCHGGDNQRFRFNDQVRLKPGTTQIVYYGSTIRSGDRCLGTVGSGAGAVFGYPCSLDGKGVVNMTWKRIGKTFVLASNPNLCLDVSGAGTADKTPVIAYRCTGNKNQQWDEAYDTFPVLKPQHEGAENKCLDVVNNGDNNVILYTCHGDQNQRVKFIVTKEKGVGELEMPNYRCLGVNDKKKSQTVRGAADCRYVGMGKGEYEWKRNGTVFTLAANPKLCLDVSGAGTVNGTPVITYPCTGNKNQSWLFKNSY